METKKEIRKEVLKRRRECPIQTRHTFSEIIAEKIVCHPWFKEAESIYCYVDFDGEVETRNMIETAFKTGKQVYVPKVHGSWMQFYPVMSLNDLKPGSFGILEPVISEKYQNHTKQVSSENDSALGKALMIMPGIAFDADRNRIGYGRGYYDKYLKEHPGFRTIALAFECQIVERIPAETLDIRPQQIITEMRML